MDYKKITFDQAFSMMQELKIKNGKFAFIDIRRPDEFAAGHINGAILLPVYEIFEKMEEIFPDKNIPVFIYCRTGRRTIAGSLILIDMGYDVYDVGGIYDLPKDFEFCTIIK
ncbi:MAG: rhodanese-like domain-containing protein [Defluviitaleaceae bacterium]|nr:rhodanese-like domain-containing protein [Defluviitaleaceae bacterium]